MCLYCTCINVVGRDQEELDTNPKSVPYLLELVKVKKKIKKELAGLSVPL